LSAALLLAAVGGACAGSDDFPPSLDHPVLAAWLKTHTDLPLDRVALAGPTHVVAVMPAGVDSAGVRRAVVEGEVVDRDWASAHRLVSWRTDVEVDCATGRVRSPTGNSYPQRKRRGAAAAVFASADWTIPRSGDPIFGVVGALCRADYPWPLRPAPKLTAVQIAQRDARSAPSAPAGSALDAPIRTAARVVEAAPASPAYVRPPPARAEPAPATPPPAARPAPTQTPTHASSGRGPFAVQVMASSTETGARASLATLARVLSVETRGLPRLASPVDTGGKRLYRAMFGGLDGEPQAQDLCKAITRLGYACIVRKR
jgi:hypothetical protein